MIGFARLMAFCRYPASLMDRFTLILADVTDLDRVQRDLERRLAATFSAQG